MALLKKKNMKDGEMVLNKRLWKEKEQILFLNRLGMLLDKGYPLIEAIDFMMIQLDDIKKQQLENGIETLNNGEPFYKVMETLKFHSTAISFAYYAEKNGELPASLQIAGKILSHRNERKAKFKKLLTYPITLVFITMIMFYIIIWQLLPRFMYLYETFQSKPNVMIRMFVWLANHSSILFLTIVIILGTSFFLYFQYQRKKGTEEMQVLLVKIPIIGNLIREWHTYYFAFHMSQLIKNGIALNDSLKLLKHDPQHPFLETIIEKIEEQLFNGENFNIAIRNVPIWHKELSYVIRHGQLSGRLDIELEAFSQTCLERFFESIEKSVKVIQPVLFGFIALWIILLYFSILLPSFQMINTI